MRCYAFNGAAPPRKKNELGHMNDHLAVREEQKQGGSDLRVAMLLWSAAIIRCAAAEQTIIPSREVACSPYCPFGETEGCVSAVPVPLNKGGTGVVSLFPLVSVDSLDGLDDGGSA